MATAAGPNPYYTRMAPYARKASTATGVPVAVILAQWALESGFGTSPAAVQGNNHAGIMTNGRTRSYPSLDAFTADYITTLQLPYYAKVRAKAATPGVSAQDVAEELGRSPWDRDGYRQVDAQGRPIDGTQGWKLTTIIGRDGLAALAGALTGTGPDPAQPLTAAQVAQIEAKLGVALSADVRARLLSPDTPATERAQLLTMLGADLGEASPTGIPVLDPALNAVQGAVDGTIGATREVLGLAGKALGVLTSAEFWRRAGLIAAGVGLLGAGLYLSSKG